MTAGHKWKPLQRATLGAPSEQLLRETAAFLGAVDRAGVLAYLERARAGCEYWRNDLYQVEGRRYPADELAHLNIRRTDGFPGRDWRHFQQIKNELVGAECEAIEIYPAESRLVDTSNKYHLWVCTDPTFRWPF